MSKGSHVNWVSCIVTHTNHLLKFKWYKVVLSRNYYSEAKA